MSNEDTKGVPASTGESPSEHDEHGLTSHVGEPAHPSQRKNDSGSHMGSMDENVTPVMPVVSNPINPASDDDHQHIKPQRELTPG